MIKLLWDFWRLLKQLGLWDELKKKKAYIVDPYPHRQKTNRSLAEEIKRIRGKQHFQRKGG